MLNPIVVMVKCLSCIKGRIYVNTLYFSGVFTFECLKRKKVVTMNQHVIKYIIIADTNLCMV